MPFSITDQIFKTGRRLGRPDLLYWTLPYLMVLIIIGTIAQKTMGLYDAQKMFFSSFVFFYGPVPLPAGYSVLSLITVSLICKFVFLSRWSKAKIGIHLIHLSIIILMIGGLLTALTAKEGFIPLREGQERSEIMAFADITDQRDGMTNLPFAIKLNAFHRDVYPGTMMAKDYESRVTIRDNDVLWPAIISMNEPLRYGGFTFYQSSLLMDKEGQPISVLSVVSNRGWVFPYISGILLAIGLIYHLIWTLWFR